MADDNVAGLILEGRFDANTSEDVERHIKESMEKGRYKVVLDLEKVPFIASAGLRVVLVYARELRKKHKGDLRLAALQKNVSKVFEISGLNNVVGIYDNMQAALESFKTH